MEPGQVSKKAGNYRPLVDNMLDAYARHQVVTDHCGNPVDYIFLDVNLVFEELTHLKKEEIIGRKATEILPGLASGDFDWINVYGKVALGGEHRCFESYSEPLGRWYEVNAFRDEPGFFITVFRDITGRKHQEEAVSRLFNLQNKYLQKRAGEIDYQEVADDLCFLSGARFTLVNIHKEDGRSTLTEAVSGNADSLEQIGRILGHQLVGKEWSLSRRWTEQEGVHSLKRYEDLHQLSGGEIPEQISATVMKNFNLGVILVSELSYQGKPLGHLLNIMARDEAVYYPRLLELYTGQLGMILIRNMTENRLTESNRMFKMITDNINDLVCMVDLNGIIQYISPSTKEIAGYDSREVIGKPIINSIHEDDLERVLTAIQVALKAVKEPSKSDLAHKVEYRLRTKDGSYVWVETKGNLVIEEGNAVSAIFVARDIRQRKEAEEALYLLNSELEKKVSQRTKDLEEANIALQTEVNKRKTTQKELQKILNLEKLISGLSALFVNSTIDKFDQYIDQGLAMTGKLEEIDRSYLFLFSPDGKYMSNTHEWCDEGIESQKDASQKIPMDLVQWSINILSSLKSVEIDDVTKLPPEAAAEKKIFLEQDIKSILLVPLVEKNKIFGFLGFDSVQRTTAWQDNHLKLLEVAASIFGSAMVRMRDETQAVLTNKLMSIGQLAAGVAHEINNPLQYITNNVFYLQKAFSRVVSLIDCCRNLTSNNYAKQPAEGELEVLTALLNKFEQENFTKELDQSLEQTIEGLEKIEKLVLSMRGLSYHGELEKVNADINRAVKDVVTLTRSEWNDELKLTTDLEPNLPLVECNISEINQVLLNLIINAIQAVKEDCYKRKNVKGEIVIKTAADEGNVKILIRDNGVGIPKTNLNRLFDPFFTTKPFGQGSGQGLALVYNIIQRHGGKVDVDSEEGQGATFIITLPCQIDLF